jgi:hypothetical protein
MKNRHFLNYSSDHFTRFTISESRPKIGRLGADCHLIDGMARRWRCPFDGV